ncbi:MAG: hypothetical protein QOF78_4005 [Phycisphaerales bacterium]|jgi:hypothetical protein|nr:hypothetical protein [Phycisphaerales bacterium]
MLSIIICSINPQRFDAIRRNFSRLLGDGNDYQFVGVHDAKSLCEGYNRGVAHARPETTNFIFCHDDIEILSPDFREKVYGHLRSYDVVGVAGTDRLAGGLWSYAGPPHIFGQVAHYKPPPLHCFDVDIFAAPARSVDKIQALDGLFFAARRAVVDKIRFDEQTFDGWHGYDVDFTFAAYLAGFRLGVACDIAIAHASIGTLDATWQRYVERLERKYQAQLAGVPRRPYQCTVVRTRDRAEALDVMTPRQWPPLETTST